MNNLVLLKYCSQNPEKFLDQTYMFVEKDTNLEKYAQTTKKVKNLLITIQQIKDKKSSDKLLEEMFVELHKIMKKYANYSEFGCFVNACDSSSYEIEYDVNLLKKITFLYLDKRDLNEVVPSEWIQAVIDKGSSRRKGAAGEKKLMSILKEKNYTSAKTMVEFNKHKKTFAKCAGKKGDFSNAGLKKHFSEVIGKTTQNKKLDLIIKKGDDVYFLEAKHMKISGGEQNKQILELIELLRNKPKKENTHYVGFLDGIYFNKLFGSEQAANKEESNKINQQSFDIRNSLKKIKQNYFMNTAGFKKLF